MFLDEKRFGELQQPPLVGFIHVLRNPDLWPEGFGWSYANCDKCAMGLAKELGYIGTPYTTAMTKAFNIEHRRCHEIFVLGNKNWFGIARTNPGQIADALEKLVDADSGGSSGPNTIKYGTSVGQL